MVIGGTLLSGGRGTIVGTVFGVLIFTTLNNVFTLNNLSISAQSVAKGLIIVIAVLLQQRLAARATHLPRFSNPCRASHLEDKMSVRSARLRSPICRARARWP